MTNIGNTCSMRMRPVSQRRCLLAAWPVSLSTPISPGKCKYTEDNCFPSQLGADVTTAAKLRSVFSGGQLLSHGGMYQDGQVVQNFRNNHRCPAAKTSLQPRLPSCWCSIHEAFRDKTLTVNVKISHLLYLSLFLYLLIRLPPPLPLTLMPSHITGTPPMPKTRSLFSHYQHSL